MPKTSLLKEFTQVALKAALPLKKIWETVTWGNRSEQTYVNDNLIFFGCCVFINFASVGAGAGIMMEELNHGELKPLLDSLPEKYQTSASAIATINAGILGYYASQAVHRVIGEAIVEDPKNTKSYSQNPYPKRKELLRKASSAAHCLKRAANQLKNVMK